MYVLYIFSVIGIFFIFCGFLSIIIGSCLTMSRNLCVAYIFFFSFVLLYAGIQQKNIKFIGFSISINILKIKYHKYTTFTKMAFHFWVIVFFLLFCIILNNIYWSVKVRFYLIVKIWVFFKGQQMVIHIHENTFVVQLQSTVYSDLV